MRHISLIVAALALAIAAPAIADKSGTPHGGGGGNDPAPASCTVSGNVVTASGLPTGVVINFQYTDATGTYGWVLGNSDNGAWSVNVLAPNGSTTYEFVSKTWGPNGSKYTVFANCSA
jgi:hypothetical protein